MPVVFVIDPAAPRDLSTSTLSYTFFEVGGKSAAAQSYDRPAIGQARAAATGQGG